MERVQLTNGLAQTVGPTDAQSKNELKAVKYSDITLNSVQDLENNHFQSNKVNFVNHTFWN